ncbi:MAG: tRNA (adenosine(37)-N6)-threonylcarbamoyltransferase complex ATPase subunit type 1 TsaE [Butyricicoccus sp.]
MTTYISHAVEETEQLGADFAAALHPGDVIAFTGDLGAGKTAFSRGVLRGLGYTGRVTSPTFAIVSEYHTERADVAHFDMYRILDTEALWELGFEEYLDGRRIVLIEWSENIAEVLPPHTLVSIRYGEQPDDRIITITEGAS